MQASRALLLPAAQRLPAPLRATARRSSSSSGGGGRCRRRAAATRAMLLEHLPALEGHRLVLASASPRRRELLAQMGLKFEVVVSSFEETLPKDSVGAAEYARLTALHKAQDVARKLAAAAAGSSGAGSGDGGAGGGGLPTLIIGADTVVEHGEHILEKPADAADAERVLRMLSGQEHHVHTGVALIMPGASAPAEGGAFPSHSFACTTTVQFDELSPEAIAAYVASGEPFDKAGSYGIQGKAGSFVVGIQGCFFNVMGFPLHRFGRELGALIESGALRV